MPVETPGRRQRILRAALIVLAIAICLGMSLFQIYRASVKTERYDQMLAALSAPAVALNSTTIAQADIAALDLHQLILHGKWLGDKTIFVDNKIRNRWVGYHVLTPFQIEGSEFVMLVNRGWIKAPRLRTELPEVATPTEMQTLTGSARRFEQRVFELAQEAAPGRVWQHVQEDAYRKNSGLSANLKVLPLMLLQTSAADDGLVREWTSPDHPALHHIGYALMWFIFSVMAALYGWMLWKRQ